VSDSLHDHRDVIEWPGNEFAAAEVRLRRQIDRLTPGKLAGCRAALIEAARNADPQLSRRERLRREIQRDRDWVARLAREREAIEAMKNPPAEELARVSGAESGQAERLRGNLAELADLPEPKPLSSAQRLESALIDERIERLARGEIKAARNEATGIICETLGPYPHADPAQAATWDNGAHAIAAYRHRHNVGDSLNPLGPRPRDQATRAERARAERRIAEAQRRLGRTRQRDAGREHSIEL
jgi:hypothetical protein